MRPALGSPSDFSPTAQQITAKTIIVIVVISSSLFNIFHFPFSFSSCLRFWLWIKSQQIIYHTDSTLVPFSLSLSLFISLLARALTQKQRNNPTWWAKYLDWLHGSRAKQESEASRPTMMMMKIPLDYVLHWDSRFFGVYMEVFPYSSTIWRVESESEWVGKHHVCQDYFIIISQASASLSGDFLMKIHTLFHSSCCSRTLSLFHPLHTNITKIHYQKFPFHVDI